MAVGNARLGGRSWGEEVVPALRKRLESESKTLARRLSAISLPSADEAKNNATSSERLVADNKGSSQKSSTGNGKNPSSSSSPSTATKTKVAKAPHHHHHQRTRTFSSPYASDYSDSAAAANGAELGRPPKSKSSSDGSRSYRAKPTRIPKVSRQLTGSTFNANGFSSSTSGSHRSTNSVTASQSPDLPYRQASSEYPRSTTTTTTTPTTATSRRLRGLTTTTAMPHSTSSRSTFDLSRTHRNIGLLHEPPPFPTHSTMSSFSGHGDEDDDLQPPRPSFDSEERPYEHWYRGEVSRNGGVGELKVGRRQEMLDIANYGHMIRSKKLVSARTQPIGGIIDQPYHHHFQRNRAGSIGGLTRKERDSLYLDDEVDSAERVLDQDPPTDLEKEEDDTHSMMMSDEFVIVDTPRPSQHQESSSRAGAEEGGGGGAYAYVPNEADIRSSTSITAELWTSTAGAHESMTMRSVTPPPPPTTTTTTTVVASTGGGALSGPSSRTPNLPPSRIPGPSSRRSSESRSTINASSTTVSATRTTPSSSLSSSSSPPAAVAGPSSSSSSSSRIPGPASSNTSTSTTTTPASLPVSSRKRAVSPATVAGMTKKARINKSKMKPPTITKREDKRTSVAMYPTVEGGEELADAIPSWTQPMSKEGNWDEVVLPVVARKKGLDGYYYEDGGSPPPKKMPEPVIVPAPGTFGYDRTKYRPPNAEDEFGVIPLDDFGVPIVEEEKHEVEDKPPVTEPTLSKIEDDTVWLASTLNSPMPVTQHVPPTSTTTTTRAGDGMQQKQSLQRLEEEEQEADGGAGCCKCVVM